MLQLPVAVAAGMDIERSMFCNQSHHFCNMLGLSSFAWIPRIRWEGVSAWDIPWRNWTVRSKAAHSWLQESHDVRWVLTWSIDTGLSSLSAYSEKRFWMCEHCIDFAIIFKLYLSIGPWEQIVPGLALILLCPTGHPKSRWFHHKKVLECRVTVWPPFLILALLLLFHGQCW